MSDAKLRELEMEWKAEAGNFAHEGGIAVAYLAELLRAGEVRHLDCVLAWRQGRAEDLLQARTASQPFEGAVLLVSHDRFDPEDPVMAATVLMVLFGDDPVLTTAHLVGPQGEPG